MFSTLVGLGVILLQAAIVVFLALWVSKSPLIQKVQEKANILLAVIFIGSALGSLIYEYSLGFEPCLLCWYQRIAIFGIAILSLTNDIRKSTVMQKQILLFSLLGLGVAILHNYIDLVPSGLDICGTGPSCLKRYVFEFGYITIPMMSFTVLLAGVLLSLSFLRKNKELSSSQE